MLKKEDIIHAVDASTERATPNHAQRLEAVHRFACRLGDDLRRTVRDGTFELCGISNWVHPSGIPIKIKLDGNFIHLTVRTEKTILPLEFASVDNQMLEFIGERMREGRQARAANAARARYASGPAQEGPLATLRVPQDVAETLRAYAKRQRVSASFAAAQAIQTFLKGEKK